MVYAAMTGDRRTAATTGRQARAWLINGADHALQLDLDVRGHIASGRLLRKSDGSMRALLRIDDATGQPIVNQQRLSATERAALSQLWRQQPARGRASPANGLSARTRARLRRLGIDEDLLATYRPQPCPEAGLLQLAGLDRFQRPLWLHPATASAWSRLRAAALRDGIVLEAVSGFRSIDYQAGLIAGKLAAGQSLAQILAVSALPGYSEHHLGRALDLHAGDGPVLETTFERTPAFAWLGQHAGRYGFRLSYPRDNPWGIAYEPWHWRHHEAATSASE